MPVLPTPFAMRLPTHCGVLPEVLDPGPPGFMYTPWFPGHRIVVHVPVAIAQSAAVPSSHTLDSGSPRQL